MKTRQESTAMGRARRLLPARHRLPRLLAAVCMAPLLGALWACGRSAETNGAAGDSSSVNPEGKQEMHQSPTATSRSYGTLADGSEVTLVTLTHPGGIEVDVISYGGIITRLVTPDAAGQPGDIVLGLDSLEEYVESSPYFGALIGRYGNRIAKGHFTLDDKTYQLDTNNGENHLHGGVTGFDKKNWGIEPFTTVASAGVVLTLVSPDGDQGYPGRLEVRVVYELTDDALDFRFSAVTDQPTIVNLTQHSYFNLAGEGDILDHVLMIPAEHFTPVDAGLIPTGEFRNVNGTPFDFRQPKPIGRDIGVDDEQLGFGLGYDHNYVLQSEPSNDLVLHARVTEPQSGRVLEIWSVEPGVQFYSGNFLDGTLEGKGTVYAQRSGFCLEPQHFPDSPNQSGFPSTALLPGDTYETRIVYRFATVE